jgi:hypothetical protein
MKVAGFAFPNLSTSARDNPAQTVLIPAPASKTPHEECTH